MQSGAGRGRDGIGQRFVGRGKYCGRIRAQCEGGGRGQVRQAELVGTGANAVAGDHQPVGTGWRVEADCVRGAALIAVRTGEGAAIHQAGRAIERPGQVTVRRQRIRVQDGTLCQHEAMDVLLPRRGDGAFDSLAQRERPRARRRVHQPEADRLGIEVFLVALDQQQVSAGLGQRERAEIIQAVGPGHDVAGRIDDADEGVGARAGIVEIEYLFGGAGERE